jgi:vacuolar protein sorting-associated protein 35
MSTKASKGSQQLSSEDPEQDRLLEEAKNMANKSAYRMKKQLDEKDIMGSLKHASDMIAELRTSLLSPKYYFELCM